MTLFSGQFLHLFLYVGVETKYLLCRAKIVGIEIELYLFSFLSPRIKT
jgi:hypothetical protein